MRSKVLRLAAALLAAAILPSGAQFVSPPPNLVVDGIPPIPAEVAEKLAPYGEFRPHNLLSWHPTKREMLVSRRLTATVQVHRVAEPGAAPEPLTDFRDTVRVAAYHPVTGESFVFPRAEGGNEVYRLYRYDVATREVTPLSPEGERTSAGRWSRKGERFVYTTQLVDRNNPDRVARTTLHIVDPAKPETDKVLATLEGGGWFGFRFSEDGRRLAFVEFISVAESHLWVMDVGTGKMRRVSRVTKGRKVAYFSPVFSRDGRGLYATTDRGSEFQRLVYVSVAGGKERLLTAHLPYDVEDFEVSFEANRIAFVTNENGSGVLRFLDLASLKEFNRPPLFPGVIGGLEWRRGSSEIGFHIASARTAGDVFSYDVKTLKLTRWTNGNNPKVNTSEFPEPTIVKWKSFDGRVITGLHYHPPARFIGKRPVYVDIHGGPTAQARPRFLGRYNYLLTELGIAIIHPNVRGSSGFGKTFLTLDDGRKREDSVKDIGALLDWIGTQPNLDAERVLVEGGSYGGYMVLATAVHYGERIAGAVDIVGISSFVTFLERTESYRRDLRRVEYGDERDPSMREFLESISPLNQAERITKPLFVIHGRNDPRVPYTEAEQIVEALKKRGTPVWYLLAKDEGHGFVKKPNADFMYGSIFEFAKATLLK